MHVRREVRLVRKCSVCHKGVRPHLIIACYFGEEISSKATVDRSESIYRIRPPRPLAYLVLQ